MQKKANKLQYSRESKQRASAAERSRKLAAGEKARSESWDAVDRAGPKRGEGINLTPVHPIAVPVFDTAELDQMKSVAQQRLDELTVNKRILKLGATSPGFDKWGMCYVTVKEKENNLAKEHHIGWALAPLFNKTTPSQ